MFFSFTSFVLLFLSRAGCRYSLMSEEEGRIAKIIFQGYIYKYYISRERFSVVTIPWPPSIFSSFPF